MVFPHATGNESPSYWIETLPPPTRYPPVEEDARADVVVVGAGIAGITAAYRLAREGKSVIVVDREQVAMAETGHTTAHVSYVEDTRLKELVPRFGLEGAKAGWDSMNEAIRFIEDTAHEEGIDCDLQRLDAYLYATREKDVEVLRKEVDLTRKIGYPVEEASPDDVPYDALAAIRFPDQRKYHPRKYLLGLVQRAEALGVRFHEGTEIVDVDSGTPATVETRDGHALTGDWLLVTTNVPFHVRFRMSTRAVPYRSYVIGARVPKGVFANALYWDNESPYHYTRVEQGEEADFVILGGEDHRVGHMTDTGKNHDALEAYLHGATDDFEVEERWSGQIIETEDGYPYIGRLPGGPENELIATGFSGTGMTNGTLAGIMLSERVLGRKTAWDDLYDPARFTLKGSLVKKWAQENVNNLKHLAKSPFKRSEVAEVADLKPGEGAIIRDGVRKLAVSRLEDGTLHAVTATCTHMGCTVAWNKAEQSWDCPCHGSRYNPDGELLHGPAGDPLEPADLEAEGEEREAPRTQGARRV